MLAATGCPAIELVTADYGPVAITGRPSPVDGTAFMYSPRRTILDHLIVQASGAAGAEVRSRCWRTCLQLTDRLSCVCYEQKRENDLEERLNHRNGPGFFTASRQGNEGSAAETISANENTVS